MKRCKYAGQYKASKAPTCNAGNPCTECKAKWKEKKEQLDRNTVFRLYRDGDSVAEMVRVLKLTRYKIQKYIDSF